MSGCVRSKHLNWKRVSALILIFALLLPTTGVPRVGAADYRLFFEDTEQTDLPALIERSGKLYAPEDLLVEKMGLNRPIFDGNTNSYTIIKNYKILAFDLNTGICITNDNRYITASVFFENGRFYFPLQLVSRELGYRYALLKNNVVRVYSYSAQLTNEEIEALTTPSAPDPVLPTPPDPPVVPPEVDPEPEEPGYYPIFTSLPGDYENLTTLLERNGLQSIFFLTEDGILENPEQVRALYTGNLTVGLSAGVFEQTPTPEELVERVEQTNDSLQRLVKRRARLVFLPKALADKLSQSHLDALSEAGYRLWTAALTFPADSRETATAGYKRFLQSVKNASETLTIALEPGSEQLLQTLFSYQKSRPISCDEYTTPHNRWAFQ